MMLNVTMFHITQLLARLISPTDTCFGDIESPQLSHHRETRSFAPRIALKQGTAGHARDGLQLFSHVLDVRAFHGHGGEMDGLSWKIP